MATDYNIQEATDDRAKNKYEYGKKKHVTIIPKGLRAESFWYMSNSGKLRGWTDVCATESSRPVSCKAVRVDAIEST